MPSLKSLRDQQVAAVTLVGYAALLLGMVLIEAILVAARPGHYTLHSDFVEKARVSFVMPLFMVYLVIGGLGLAGTLGVIRMYGTGGLATDLVKASATAYFAIGYWLWGATWIVQHKITLLSESPTNPPDWLLQIYDASDALWSLASWGALGPQIVLYAGLGLMLWRGSRRLPRIAAILFGVLAASQMTEFVLFGLRGFNSFGRFELVNDIVFAVARIAAALLAAAALYTEKGVFVRTSRI